MRTDTRVRRLLRAHSPSRPRDPRSRSRASSQRAGGLVRALRRRPARTFVPYPLSAGSGWHRRHVDLVRPTDVRRASGGRLAVRGDGARRSHRGVDVASGCVAVPSGCDGSDVLVREAPRPGDTGAECSILVRAERGHVGTLVMCAGRTGARRVLERALPVSRLRSGNHQLAVRATDLAGNVATTTYEWTVDRSAPEIEVGGKPGSFRLRPMRPSVCLPPEWMTRFLCTMDGRLPMPCASAAHFSGLNAGKHTFRAWAIDAAGNRCPLHLQLEDRCRGGLTVNIKRVGPPRADPPDP